MATLMAGWSHASALNGSQARPLGREPGACAGDRALVRGGWEPRRSRRPLRPLDRPHPEHPGPVLWASEWEGWIEPRSF